ncbi:MAG: primosomal protein N' [Clostridia bacterium]|nr:primosomal protein N' [Clostridia bacterium]
MDKAFARVRIIDIPLSIDREYSYFIPPELRGGIKAGTVVVVPFGNANKRVSAVVTGVSDECDYRGVKPVDSIMHYPFDVPEELVRTCAFMKERFFCTFDSAFRTVIPPGVNLGTETVYTPAGNGGEAGLNPAAEVLLRAIRLKGEAREKDLTDEYGEECIKLLASLCKGGFLKKFTRVPEKLNEKNLFTVCLTVSPEEAAELAAGGEGLTEKQRGLISLLINYPAATLREIEEIGGYSSAIVNALIKKGYAEKRETSFYREAYDFSDTAQEGEIVLSAEQKTAVEGLCALADSEEPKAALLFGVTGSGKTRVITECAKHVIANGKKVIILLPEIGLTSQAVKSYAAAFGKRLAVIHSMLSVGERSDTYRRIREGELDIVIGTRSAVFAPFDNIGLIAVDEEQAPTYKSETTPKYSAHDVARFRCSESNALMLLASATPSVESFYKAKNGAYTLFTLKGRYGDAALPKVIIEDMRGDPSLTGEDLIGERLGNELRAVKEQNKQALLFVNRRGYNSHISCRECGYVFACPNCSVSLTYHAYDGREKGRRRLNCHYCGYTSPLPEQCPVCGSKHIGYSGFGTQKLQDELETRFPELRVLRMDSDTTGGKFSHDKIIESFASGESDLLIGTQMISKGLDFPNVKLAGAVSVDSSLYMDDFRAGERTFSLVTQLVGRAGRKGDEGLAVLQTYNPDNEILRSAAKQDYEAFYESEIKLRRSVLFPPFCSIAVFGISSVSEQECESFSARFDALLLSVYDKDYKDVKIIKFGPFRSGIYKVMGRYRQRVIIKYKDCRRAREFFLKTLTDGMAAAPKTVRLELDANPVII